MTCLNVIVLSGNLTRDPEVRQTPTGKTVCEFSLATSDSYTSKDGARVEQACFTNIVTWNRQAEVCGQYLAKGSSVVIEGRLHFEQWEAQDGQKRSRHKVWANRIQFVGKRDKGGETEPGPSPLAEKLETVEVATTEEPF